VVKCVINGQAASGQCPQVKWSCMCVQAMLTMGSNRTELILVLISLLIIIDVHAQLQIFDSERSIIHYLYITPMRSVSMDSLIIHSNVNTIYTYIMSPSVGTLFSC